MMPDFTPPEGFALADRLPTEAAMIHIGNKGIATCPECGNPLMDYAHGEHPALLCWNCHLVWLTDANPSRTSHRELLKRILTKETIAARQRAEEAA